MKKQSFHEILVNKMNHKKVDLPETTTSYEVLDSISPLFQMQFAPLKKVAAKVYPMTTNKKTAPNKPAVEPATVAPPQEVWVHKSQLTEQECSAWNLFEKTMGQTFSDKVSRSQVLRAFRTFAKKNHPDVAANGSTYNFGFIIKVKNEMLAIVEKHSASASSSPTTAA